MDGTVTGKGHRQLRCYPCILMDFEEADRVTLLSAAGSCKGQRGKVGNSSLFPSALGLLLVLNNLGHEHVFHPQV